MHKARKKVKENHTSNVVSMPTQNQSEQRMKNFIPSSVNPDNNAFFGERSNPLSSKGD